MFRAVKAAAVIYTTYDKSMDQSSCRLLGQIFSDTPNIVQMENPRFSSFVDLFLEI